MVLWPQEFSLVIIAVVNGIGSKLNTKFTAINTSLE
jgi:Flp pilus assembly pilin Flp